MGNRVVVVVVGIGVGVGVGVRREDPWTEVSEVEEVSEA